MKLNKALTYFPFWIGLLAGLFFVSLHVTGFSLTHFPGDFIDARFNNYLLEHAWRFFTGQEATFWDAPFMYPEEEVISYSDNLLGSAPFYCLFRLFGADRETSFQLWYLLIAVLNYSCCYGLLRFLFKNTYAAACGAMVFAFSLALQSQMGHAQTFPRFAIPLCLWALLLYQQALSPRYFFAALLCLVYQLYCGMYLGLLLAIPFAVFMLVSLLMRFKAYWQLVRSLRWWLGMAGSGAACGLLLLPLMLPYLARAKQTGLYPFERVLETIPTPGSYFFSWKGSLWWDSLSETCTSYPAFWDHEIFTGMFASAGFFSVVLILLAGLFYRKLFTLLQVSSELKALMLTGLITFALFLRVEGVSLYRLVHAIPGYGSMRALQRIVNIELVFFAAGMGWLVHLLTKKQNVLSALLATLLLFLIAADNYVQDGFIHQKEKAASQARISALVAKMEALPKDAVVSYEPDSMSSSPMDYQLDAMLASQSLGLVTLNGYSATSPGGYGPYWVTPNEESRKAWLERKGKAGLQVSVIK